MNLLLDTHALIWHCCDSSRLGRAAAAILMDGSHDVFVSVACFWEISIKNRTGKLQMPATSQAMLFACEKAGITVLPIRIEHVLAVETLPLDQHRDPFDRIMVAQASVEGLTLVSNDGQFDGYDVKRIW